VSTVTIDLGLPEAFRNRILATKRRDWSSWLDELPEIVATCCDRWELSLGEAFDLSWNYVVAAETAGGTPCVLKAEPPVQPDGEGVVRELRALQLAGPSAVGVIESDADLAVMLLERAIPGDVLADRCAGDDDGATEILAGAMEGFWQPVDEDDRPRLGLPDVTELKDIFERFDRGPHGSIARRKKAKSPASGLATQLGLDEAGTGIPSIRAARDTAERVLGELQSDRVTARILHGDLHHENVLYDEGRGFVVIDPKGFVGDPSYEIGAALYNPLAMVSGITELRPLFDRRIAIYCSVLGLDREKVTAWSYVKAVFSALWVLEDGGTIEGEDDLIVRSIATLRTMI